MIDSLSIDTFLKIGKQHSICEDYIISGLDPVPYVILADGCSSSGLMKDCSTDLGSRLICYSAKQALKGLQSAFQKKTLHYNLLAELTIGAVQHIPSMLGLSTASLDATLLVAFIQEDFIFVYVYGDGNIISVKKDDTIIRFKLSYKGNAPDYLTYRIDAKRKALYEKLDNQKRIQRIDYVGKETVLQELNLVPAIFAFPVADTKQVLIASDGIESFLHTKCKLTTTEKVTKDLVAFKNSKGEFIQRRLKRMLKLYEQEGIYHYDDISVGGFSL